MANRTPAQSARLSRMSKTYSGNTDASLLREARSTYKPRSPKQAIIAAWEAQRISWPQAQAMARDQGVTL